MSDDERERLAEALWLADGYDLNADPDSSTAREMKPEYLAKVDALTPILAAHDAALLERVRERFEVLLSRYVARDQRWQVLEALDDPEDEDV